MIGLFFLLNICVCMSVECLKNYKLFFFKNFVKFYVGLDIFLDDDY